MRGASDPFMKRSRIHAGRVIYSSLVAVPSSVVHEMFSVWFILVKLPSLCCYSEELLLQSPVSMRYGEHRARPLNFVTHGSEFRFSVFIQHGIYLSSMSNNEHQGCPYVQSLVVAGPLMSKGDTPRWRQVPCGCRYLSPSSTDLLQFVFYSLSQSYSQGLVLPGTVSLSGGGVSCMRSARGGPQGW